MAFLNTFCKRSQNIGENFICVTENHPSILKLRKISQSQLRKSLLAGKSIIATANQHFFLRKESTLGNVTAYKVLMTTMVSCRPFDPVIKGQCRIYIYKICFIDRNANSFFTYFIDGGCLNLEQ